MNDFCIFGEFVRAMRIKQCLPLWKFASAIPFPQSNVQRIETGYTEPRIGLAMRMLLALNVDAGIAMRDIAISMKIIDEFIHAGKSLEMSLLEFSITDIGSNGKSPAMLFGRPLKNARLAMGRTQAQMADAAYYSRRSLILVEQGRQEPGLVSALKLGAETGWRLDSFFATYGRLIKHE